MKPSEKKETEIRINSNQGILQSAKNSMIIGLITGLSGGIIMATFIGGVIGLDSPNIDIIMRIIGLNFGLIFGISSGLYFGGLAVIQHFALRFVLCREGHLPWKLVPFLDYAAERIFLRKVGGGYVFVHRMLMDYFADLEPGPGGR
jgi:hypothetical protein